MSLDIHINFKNNKPLFILLFFIITSEIAFGNIHSGLFPSVVNNRLYEIGRIEFVGNNSFSKAELLTVISSRETQRTWQHQIFQFLSNEIGKNQSAPALLKANLKKTVENYYNEIRFFDENRIFADTLSLWHFYNMRGFHQVQINFSFKPDSNRKINILTFFINENPRYKISKLTYLGLDSLPENLLAQIKNIQTIKPNTYFNEEAIVDEIRKINRFLLDNGYYSSRFEDPPLVLIDTSKKTDSVIVIFHPGNRFKISSIDFIDSTRGQYAISHNTKKQQLEFSIGDWYSRSKILQSEENLRFLGTFDVVKIDTINSFHSTDTTLAINVFLQYKKLQEWNLGWFINQTTFGNFINSGIEGAYINRNLLGKAQVFNPYARILIKDITKWLSSPFNNFIEFEGQIGISFGQPLLWIWENSRIGVFWNPLYSYRYISGNLPLATFSFPVKFPVKLPGITYFNNMAVDFLFEWQKPLNYEEARNKALSNAVTHTDSLKVIESIILLDALNNYYRENPIIYPAANIIGVGLFADHRDNFFTPSRGDYALISLDAGLPIGIARYLRFQFAYNRYHSFNKYTVLAFKSRIGLIYQWDADYTYIPFERLFFSGGANSVRGWPSRKLRYSTMPTDTSRSNLFVEFIENFLGSKGIFEGSIEVRYRFQRTNQLGEFWDEHIANMGMAVFLDIGNAFHWIADNYTDTKFTDYFTKLALAAGLGLRYNTPVGPLRIDFGWPIYDPSAEKNQWLWQKENFLTKFAFHVALGNAF